MHGFKVAVIDLLTSLTYPFIVTEAFKITYWVLTVPIAGVVSDNIVNVFYTSEYESQAGNVVGDVWVYDIIPEHDGDKLAKKLKLETLACNSVT
jgi:uncharacterized protein (DUF2062 family)